MGVKQYFNTIKTCAHISEVILPVTVLLEGESLFSILCVEYAYVCVWIIDTANSFSFNKATVYQ